MYVLRYAQFDVYVNGEETPGRNKQNGQKNVRRDCGNAPPPLAQEVGQIGLNDADLRGIAGGNQYVSAAYKLQGVRRLVPHVSPSTLLVG